MVKEAKDLYKSPGRVLDTVSRQYLDLSDMIRPTDSESMRSVTSARPKQ